MPQANARVIRKLWALLDRQRRRDVVVLIALMLIGMVLETAGIGLVIPVLAVITQPDLLARYPGLAPVLRALGNPGPAALVIGGMALLVAFYLLKNVFLGFVAWRQMSFVFGLQEQLSHTLFAGYLRQPYPFHLIRNSAQLIRNVIGQVNDITTVTLGGMLLLTEVQVLAGIVVLLLIVEPVGALLVSLTIGGTGWLFYRATRARILRWGEARQVHEVRRLQYLQEGLGGAKEVKLLGREGDFIAQFQAHNMALSRIGRHQSALQQVPKLAIELLAVAGLAALVIVMVVRGRRLDLLLPTLGVFGAAAFRLMPSVNRIIGGLQSLKYIEPAVDTIHAEIGALAPAPSSAPAVPLRLTRELALDDVAFAYEGASGQALRGVTLSVAQGSSVGFVGGSGGGKTTLIDLVLGLLTPTHGAVRVDGVDIRSNLRGWQDQIGYVPQAIFLSDDTLRRNIAFGVPEREIDDTAVQRAVRAARLEQLSADLPLGLETLVGERGVRLSGGQRQRIGIARALYHDPSVLVLDEATSALDVATEAGVMEAVRALHGTKTILIVAHRTTTVAHCDRVFRIDDGRLTAQGSPAAVLHAAASIH